MHLSPRAFAASALLTAAALVSTVLADQTSRPRVPAAQKPAAPAPSASASAPAAPAEPWRTWGGPRANFTSPSSGLADAWPASGPPQLWTRTLGDGYSAIAEEN